MAISCQLCKKDAIPYFTVRDFNQARSKETFTYYICTSCKIIFASPIPENLGDYYTPAYPAYQIPTIQELEVKAEQERYKLEILHNVITHGRLLEIGPASGGFAYLAKQAGFEVEAIEMDERCCQFLKEVVGIKAVNSNDIPKALNDLQPYDAIILWHVIEHLADPWGTLEAITNKLLPGGILLIAAPNPHSLQFNIFGRYWMHVDAPRHLELIPLQLLTKQLVALGMRPVLITTRDKASTIFSTFGWWLSSFYIFLRESHPLSWEKMSKYLVKAKRPTEFTSFSAKISFFRVRLINRIITYILRVIYSLILRPLERVEGQGCAYTAILRKI
jgi:2-polyprenyl-3-methyl-5-hydroxy-6-metoxy-1,4-benzoquinol methylase